MALISAATIPFRNCSPTCNDRCPRPAGPRDEDLASPAGGKVVGVDAGREGTAPVRLVHLGVDPGIAPLEVGQVVEHGVEVGTEGRVEVPDPAFQSCHEIDQAEPPGIGQVAFETDVNSVHELPL